MEKEEIGKAMFEMQVMENRLKQLDQQLGLVEQRIMEDEMLESNLGEFKKSDKSEVILPVGGGIFVRGGIEKMDKVLLGVGAGIVVEKDLEDTKKFVGKRKQKFAGLREELAHQVKTIVASISEIEQNIQNMQGDQANASEVSKA